MGTSGSPQACRSAAISWAREHEFTAGALQIYVGYRDAGILHTIQMCNRVNPATFLRRPCLRSCGLKLPNRRAVHEHNHPLAPLDLDARRWGLSVLLRPNPGCVARGRIAKQAASGLRSPVLARFRAPLRMRRAEYRAE